MWLLECMLFVIAFGMFFCRVVAVFREGTCGCVDHS
jgi:hypothetical protein